MDGWMDGCMNEGVFVCLHVGKVRTVGWWVEGTWLCRRPLSLASVHAGVHPTYQSYLS